MSLELWATYSVKDHLEPRALATDIVLFDRLVFPVPETGQITGNPIQPGPVEWKRNPEEWRRWEIAGWDPDRQERILQLLKPIVRKHAWTDDGPTLERYRSESARLAAQGLPDYAFAATRTTLTRDLPAYVDGVAAMGPAYRSLDDITRDFSIRGAGVEPHLPADALATALAWEFFAPDPNDAKISTEELLRETVAFVTGDKEFQKHRTAFVEWQQKFIRGGVTDRKSIEHALEAMRASLLDANKAAERLRVRKIARYATRIAPTAIGLVLAALGIPGGIAVAAGGGMFSVGSIVIDEKLFPSAEQRTPPWTAFILDARRHFGRK